MPLFRDYKVIDLHTIFQDDVAIEKHPLKGKLIIISTWSMGMLVTYHWKTPI